MKKILKRTGIGVLCILLVLVLVVGGYIAYLSLQYSRIPDHTPLEVDNNPGQLLEKGTGYSALTYNIGFGAYNHDFSFFMDSGRMLDGTEVTGKHARAQSLAIVTTNTAGAIAEAKKLNPDFLLFQEADKKADRSWQIDQTNEIRQAFPGYGAVYASNFHSAYLAYPFLEPHGAVEAGLQTLSRFSVKEAQRRSYPVDPGFPTKFFDLDRCFSVLRLPVEGGGELVLINSHMSAYDKGGTIRAAQMEMLAGVLKEEAEKGNWVIVGGDFNHALGGSIDSFASEQQQPEWVFAFDENDLPTGYSVVVAEDAKTVPTCRSTDIPYTKGVNYTTILDGFIVSENVTATAENIDTDFAYSDHNPVYLSFQLN